MSKTLEKERPTLPPPPLGLFPPLRGRTEAEQVAGNVRAFLGDGTPYLRVVGLKALTGVRVGTEEIPLFLTQKFPDAANVNGDRIEATWPMVWLTAEEDGTPVILRSVQSNDGLWQTGATIFVAGEWEEPAPDLTPNLTPNPSP